MADSEKATDTHIDLTETGVLESLIRAGSEVVLFRWGIEERGRQIIIDGETEVAVFISNPEGKENLSVPNSISFNVPLTEAQRIVQIRSEIKDKNI